MIAVAGFVLFLAKCRPISVRSGDAFHEIRPRAEAANLSAHSASPIQDAVLKRLSLLEDIVYRQLNGKDARGCPWGSARAGRAPGASRGALSSVWKAGTSWLPRAPFSSPCPFSGRRPGLLERITCFIFLYFSCKFASVVERGQRRILTCRHHYLATLVQVQKLATRPNGTGGAGHLRGAKALTA